MKPSSSAPRKAIDWQELRARLAQAIQGTAAALQPSPERIEAILRERARVLASVRRKASRAADAVEVLTFRVGNDCFAIATQFVRAVRPLGDWTPIPAGPDFLLGVFPLHGQVVALFDLGRRLGLVDAALPDTGPSQVLVLGTDRIEFGVSVSEVVDVSFLGADEILPAPAAAPGMAREHLRGVTGKAVLVLDGDALLRDALFYLDQDEDATPASHQEQS